jgi:hypothetical protein
VRLLLRHGVTLPELAGLLRELYVELADDELRGDGGSATDSRVSLRTGIHRKDVRRLRRGVRAAPFGTTSLGARLLARWLGSPELRDANGHVLPLPQRTPPEGGPSFEALVRSVSRDIRPRTVLDDWLDSGLVEVREGTVVLDPRRLAAEPSFEERTRFFADQLRDHIAAGAHNLTGGTPPCLDRSVAHGALGEEAARELEALSRELAMEALRTVDRRARELRARDAGATTGGVRIRLGVYLRREPDPAAGSPPAGGGPKAHRVLGPAGRR